MAHFAHVPNITDGKGIVTNVIVIEQDVLNSGLWGDPATWYQTSYNTRAGVHYAPDSNTPDGGIAFRGNFAGIGDTYDSVNDVFYKPQPYPSWTISESTNWTWKAPVDMPSDAGTGMPPKIYTWDEATTSWVSDTTE